MHKLDLNIARLKLLRAELTGKREMLAASRHQYHDQLARLVAFVVHEDGGVDRTLAMMMDVDSRLQELARQEHYLNMIWNKAERELESLQLTKLIEEARTQMETLRLRAKDIPGADEGDAAWLTEEIRRLEGVIATASGAAVKSISDGR